MECPNCDFEMKLIREDLTAEQINKEFFYDRIGVELYGLYDEYQCKNKRCNFKMFFSHETGDIIPHRALLL
jgi:hypothetical protein